jgi:integrase
MNRFDLFPPDIRRSIPATIEKGIYPRIHVAKDGSVGLIWWVRVWKDAKPISQSAESSRYSDAVALKKKLISEIETGRRAGGNVDQIRLARVLDDYVAECDVSERVRQEYRLQADNRIKPKLGKVRIVKLTSDRFKEYRKLRVAEIVAKKAKNSDRIAVVTKAANTTVNREGALIHAALVHGQRRTPRTVLTIPYFPKTSETDNARQGFLEADNYVELRDGFSDPAVRLLFIVAYNVGCRSGELRQFEWSMVDLRRRCNPFARPDYKERQATGRADLRG